jgi:hypothetical protein
MARVSVSLTPLPSKPGIFLRDIGNRTIYSSFPMVFEETTVKMVMGISSAAACIEARLAMTEGGILR